MSQPLDDKKGAIASVLWLLPQHYTMLTLGRRGVVGYHNELEERTEWRPPTIAECEAWPVEKLCAWFAYQRRLSKRYRLFAISLALAKLRMENRAQAAAVEMEYVHEGIYTWYSPDEVLERAEKGLEYMAKDVRGVVPWFGEDAKTRRDARIREMHAEGFSGRAIARAVGCSRNTVRAVLQPRLDS